MEEEGPGTSGVKESRKQKVFNFSCECGKNFNHKNHFNAHQRKVHDILKSTPINHTEKHCPLCDFSARLRDEMIKHFGIIHNIKFVEEKLTFASQDEFLSWKRKLESDTNSKFTNKGTRKFSKHTLTQFHCHRSGCFATRGKGLRSLKKQGSNKMNSFCPSRMIQKCFNDGTCIVHFSSPHVGHQNDIKHLTLTSTEREELAKKLSLKIPFDEILDQIRDSINENSLQRIHLLTRKDLYNIEAAYNLQSKAVRHKSDAISVDAWVREMENERNCVLFYKPQGVHSENNPNLKAEDFVLMIMTEAQLEILKKYGNECVCLDGTNGLNRYDFQLNTLLVMDELREGFPCAFLISNRSDTQVLALFFEKIKDQLKEPLKPKVFMSDLADKFFNAWNSIMGIPEKRLFCTWHVDRCWRKNLNKIKSRDTQVFIYKHLRTLLTERDPNAFQKMLKQFCCIDDVECSVFIKYFQQYYASNYEYWAYSYRLHAGINTNMHLERMHRSIKYIYLKGKTGKRLDKGIAAIMRYIRDKLINRVIVNNEGKISGKIANIQSRHQTMRKMDPSKLIPSDGGWEILSENCQEIYAVQKQETNCQNCQMVCLHCDICIHQFQCSCLDSAIEYNMCKHIHLVASLIKDTKHSNYKDIAENNVPAVSKELNCSSEISELRRNTHVHDDLNERKEKLKIAFLETLHNISSSEEIYFMEKHFARAGPKLAD